MPTKAQEPQKIQEESFEILIERSKNALTHLSKPDLTLKESLEIYKKGLKDLKKAQKLIEEAKLEYETLNANDNKI